jgi:hypothetical protein
MSEYMGMIWGEYDAKGEKKAADEGGCEGSFPLPESVSSLIPPCNPP